MDLWKKTTISSDGTHHLLDGKPLYAACFLQVLSFHAPGLSAVQDENCAYHIDMTGKAVYPFVFSKTFGFYDGLAAVANCSEQFYHIHADGTSAYKPRYQWCGNFQGGFSVVSCKDGYGHIDPNGNFLCKERFSYAGDFRDHRAVVRLKDGYCAHINEKGEFAHPHRYLDLDVYHKGYARARDLNGWMHIDRYGFPAYKTRFSSVEPFYNGNSLAVTLDGDAVIIDTEGKITRLIQSKNNFSSHIDFSRELSDDMVGYWKTYTIAAAVELALAEKFPFPDHAVENHLDLPGGNARIILHALAELSIVHLSGGMWHLSEKGKFLLVNHPFSLNAAAKAWAMLAESGSKRWLSALTEKKQYNVFSEMGSDSEKNITLHKMLSAYASRDYASLPAALCLNNMKKIIDAGGGAGILGKLIVDMHEDIEVIVLDLAKTLSYAPREISEHPRIVKYAKDIFSPWGISGDSVILTRVIHDWNDECALKILRNARAALATGNKIFIVETIKNDIMAAGLCSFHLLTTGGGRERTLAEYKQLLSACGFNFVSVRALENHMSVITGEST